MSRDAPDFTEIQRRIEKTENTEVLAAVYAEQMDFARFHNGLVWQVSSVWVPIALAGLTLDFRSEGEEFDIVRLRFVAYGSIGLLVLWTCLAEWHRWVWINSYHVGKLIEAKWDLEKKWPSPPTFWIQGPPSSLGLQAFALDLGRIFRLLLAISALTIWIIRLVSGEIYSK